MARPEVHVIGGTKEFSHMTAELQKENPRRYDVVKAMIWLDMLKDNMPPVKWLEPNKKGTKVNFDCRMYAQSFAHLKTYIDEINEKHNVNLRLEIEDNPELTKALVSVLIESPPEKKANED